MIDIHIVFGALGIGYVALVLMIARLCAFSDSPHCTGNCEQGRKSCDCETGGA